MGFGSGKTELGPEADPGEVGEFDVPLFNGYCSSEKRKIMKSMKLIFCKSSPLLAQILREINFEECICSNNAVFWL